MPSYTAREQAPYDSSPRPFSTLDLHPQLAKGITDLGFKETRPVQAAVLPYALAGDDVIACAETGTGKTGAFVLPILQRLLTGRRRRRRDARPRRARWCWRRRASWPCRSKTPSRACSITQPARARPSTAACRWTPGPRAARGVHLVVATPGRLMDHMRSAAPDFSKLEVLVLDEADRMMDMGFWPDVQRSSASCRRRGRRCSSRRRCRTT